jgi:hypothetical protein
MYLDSGEKINQYLGINNPHFQWTTPVCSLQVGFSLDDSSINKVLFFFPGVFGAGKSYLLAVLVIFLNAVFNHSDLHTPGVPFPWKILISSTTNVAVDRILMG